MNIRINPRIKRFDKALRGAFIEKAVAENKMIVRAAMIFIIIAELINIIRVLFLSNSGLGTFNNRVYFTFYTVYFAGAVVVLRICSRGCRRGEATRCIPSRRYRRFFGTPSSICTIYTPLTYEAIST